MSIPYIEVTLPQIKAAYETAFTKPGMDVEDSLWLTQITDQGELCLDFNDGIRVVIQIDGTKEEVSRS